MSDERRAEGRVLLEEARRRAVTAFGAESPVVHGSVALELMSARFCGAGVEDVFALGEARIPAAERVLGWRSPAITAAHQNHALVAMQLNKCDVAIREFQSALRGEVAARGEQSGMAQWIAANLAVAALRCDRWSLFVEIDDQLWKSDPTGPRPAWETVVELIDLLEPRGEYARVDRWLSALDRINREQAGIVRERVGASRSR